MRDRASREASPLTGIGEDYPADNADWNPGPPIASNRRELLSARLERAGVARQLKCCPQNVTSAPGARRAEQNEQSLMSADVRTSYWLNRCGVSRGHGQQAVNESNS